jgi:hypothetical protein
MREAKIWRVSDRNDLHTPGDFQYMNPASYGPGVTDADSTISYSSTENWYKRRAKYSKSSDRSSKRDDSAQLEAADDNFLNDLLCKNEDVENHSLNINQDRDVCLASMLSNKRIEQSISKYSSHLNLAQNEEEVPENKNLMQFEASDQNNK